MRHSLYIHLATWFIRADLRREERAWRRKIRRTAYTIPWHSEHLLRDIGLEPDGRFIGKELNAVDKTDRRLRHIRRLCSLRMPT
jgi:hypothetical protein